MSSFQWTLEQPEKSQMFSSWGINYRSTTASQNGRLVTTLWRNDGPPEVQVATVEWGTGDAPGRIYMARHWVPLADFLRLEAVSALGYTRSFIAPGQLHLKWVPDPRSHGLFLVDNFSRNYGRLEPIPERRIVAPDGRVQRIGHILSFTGSGQNLNSDQREWILVTSLVYRCLTTLRQGR